MRQLKRIAGALAIQILLWIVAAFTSYTAFFVGTLLAWAWLWATNGREHFPKMYWARLLEPRILLFMSILGVSHAVPGYVVLTGFASYFWIFFTIATVHIALEIFIVCTRSPNKKKKEPKFSVERAGRKWSNDF